MTDDEIIKALERCPQHTECCYCNSLEECGNKRILTTSVFDLINRQKAEIERLKEEANKYQTLWCIAVKDIETAQSEARKEFVEQFEDRIEKELESTYKAWFIASETIVEESKLHISSENAIKKIRDCLNRYEPISYYKVVKTIDNLLEEMEEKKNGKENE